MWWEDREKVRKVVELERVITAIQEEIAAIELSGGPLGLIPNLYAQKVQAVRERDAITGRPERHREASGG